MPNNGERLSRIEAVYCMTVSTGCLGLIASIACLKNEAMREWIANWLAIALIVLFPAGIVMEVAHGRKPIPGVVAVCIGLSGFILFLFLLANRRGYS